MIEAILFDFGGVIASYYRPELFRQQEARLGLAPGTLADLLWNSPDWRLAEVGTISDQEYWRRIGPKLGLDSQDELRLFQQTLFGDVQADPQMVDLLRRLKRGYRVGLLSNAGDSLPRALRERYGLDDLFDVIVVSALVGLSKPDPAIYRLALEYLGSQPETTVFVDDYQPNVAAATAMGLHAIHFVGHDSLISSLLQLGVVV